MSRPASLLFVLALLAACVPAAPEGAAGGLRFVLTAADGPSGVTVAGGAPSEAPPTPDGGLSGPPAPTPSPWPSPSASPSASPSPSPTPRRGGSGGGGSTPANGLDVTIEDGGFADPAATESAVVVDP